MEYLILANNSGGLYRFRKELMQRLMDDGHTVYAVTPFDDSVGELRAMGVRLIEQKMNRRGTNLVEELRLLCAYRRIIRQIRPDMILTYTIKPGIYGGLLARWKKIPYAVNITGLGTAFQKQGLLRMMIVRLWRAAVGKAGVVFFENEENARVFADLEIADRSRMHVLHGAGVNLQDFPFTEYPVDECQLRFLFIGRVMKEKGVDELLDAMMRLSEKYPQIHLDVVGGCEEDYETRLNELENKGILTYHGHQPDVTGYIRSAHVFVLPSYHEGMANTLLEAAAMGRPLITSRIHGCMEAVQENVTGFLCEVSDARSLCEQMERFVVLPRDKKAEMGRKAHDHVAAVFDKKKVVQETVDVLYRMGETL